MNPSCETRLLSSTTLPVIPAVTHGGSSSRRAIETIVERDGERRT